METILVIEDEKAILAGLRQNLSFEGYQVLTAEDGKRGLELAVSKTPDLVLLDVMMPKLSGFEVCKMIRQAGLLMPVIMLTARADEVDKIMGLDIGADDYITKPFSIRELLARVKAAMRRRKSGEILEGKHRIGEIEVDFEGRSLTRGGKAIPTTKLELDFLQYLLANPNRALSRAQILNRIWGSDYFGTDRTIDNFVTRLRQKIEKDPARPKHLLTVRGIGYKFVP